MQEKATLKRYGIFLMGVLICAMGIAFLSRSALGTSPLSSVSFVLYLVLGCPIMSLGITLEVLANVTILPGEGIVKTLAAKGGWEFGNVKVAFDCTLTAIASVIAFITFGRLNGVGIGTLVSALAVGQLVKLYSRCIKRSAARRAGGGAVQ